MHCLLKSYKFFQYTLYVNYFQDSDQDLCLLSLTMNLHCPRPVDKHLLWSCNGHTGTWLFLTSIVIIAEQLCVHQMTGLMYFTRAVVPSLVGPHIK